MLSILSNEQIRECDEYTIANEPIDSIDLMERACTSFTDWFTDHFTTRFTIDIVCGPGNNGGDGLGIARLLIQAGYDVNIFIFSSKGYSTDFTTNYERIKEICSVRTLEKNTPQYFTSDILIDAIFGSGLSRKVSDHYAEIIEAINNEDALVVSVDLPSGMGAEIPGKGAIIRADFTITFQVPRLSLLLPESGSLVGAWEIIDIGLMPEALNVQITDKFLVEEEDIRQFWPYREKFDHKSTFGHCLMAGGSYGKIGAIVLSAKSALRSGAGLVTVCTIPQANDILQISIPEAMVWTGTPTSENLSLPPMDKFNVVGCGPGMGTCTDSVYFLQELLRQWRGPLVLDADALTILSENRELLSVLSPNTILTPHPGEFKRLVGNWENDTEKLSKLQSFCMNYKVITVLKGAHSITCSAEGVMYFNSTGNPGMATAGSGDVLTGIVTALLGQMKDPLLAVIAGVYIHGSAGDWAAEELGEEALIASDIIEFLPAAIKALSI